jgi:hypothetical protein
MRHDVPVADPAAPPPRDRRLRVVRDDERAPDPPPGPESRPAADGAGGPSTGTRTEDRPAHPAPHPRDPDPRDRPADPPPHHPAPAAPAPGRPPDGDGRVVGAGRRGWVRRGGWVRRVAVTIGLVGVAIGTAALVDAAVGGLDGVPAVHLLALFALPLWDRLPARVSHRVGLLGLVVVAVGAAWFGLAALRPEPWWRAEVAFGLACAAVGTVHAALPRRRTVVP